jgi:hypothetical protein
MLAPRHVMFIRRIPWQPDFPEVIVHVPVAIRDAHADYAAAKAGAHGSSVRLARDLIAKAAVERLQAVLAGRRPVLVPVRAIETQGINLIPDAMAHHLARALDLTVTTEIVQTNTVGHTRAGGYHRLVFQPTFAGNVERGADYVLVDDHVGLGATLANLRGHIEAEGGRVITATTMSASRRSEVLALRPETLQSLHEKHGRPLEDLVCDQLGFELDRLTEAEAGYLLRSASLDAIRAGMVEARR